MDTTIAVAAISAGAGFLGSALTLLGTQLNSRRSDRQAAQRARDEYLRQRHDRFDHTLAELSEATSAWSRDQGIALRALANQAHDADAQLFWHQRREGETGSTAEDPREGEEVTESTEAPAPTPEELLGTKEEGPEQTLEDLLRDLNFLQQDGILAHDKDFFERLEEQYDTITRALHRLEVLVPSAGAPETWMFVLRAHWSSALTTRRYLEHARGPWDLSDEQISKAYLEGTETIQHFKEAVRDLVRWNRYYVEDGAAPTRGRK